MDPGDCLAVVRLRHGRRVDQLAELVVLNEKLEGSTELMSHHAEYCSSGCAVGGNVSPFSHRTANVDDMSVDAPSHSDPMPAIMLLLAGRGGLLTVAPHAGVLQLLFTSSDELLNNITILLTSLRQHQYQAVIAETVAAV